MLSATERVGDDLVHVAPPPFRLGQDRLDDLGLVLDGEQGLGLTDGEFVLLNGGLRDVGKLEERQAGSHVAL